MGELELIEKIRSGWGSTGRSRSSGSVVLGIGDDCAILRPPRGHEVLVTTDFTLEGRHFRRDWHSAESAGHRALARGLSDLAAMGAKPLAAFLSLALPREMLSTRKGQAWTARFFTGLRGLAERHNVPLAGGDTAESPAGLVLADIVLVGSAPAGRSLRRSGAKAGDLLYVTGALGGAAAELEGMASRVSKRQPLLDDETVKDGTPGLVAHPQLYPEPRLPVGQALLRRRLANAAIDLSDGISTDLEHLCKESGVAAEIDARSLPIHPLAAANRDPEQALQLALHGGEDYELLFAATAAIRIPRSLAGVCITPIGRLVPGTGVSLVGLDGRRRLLKPGGWEHFAGEKSATR
jgi:thiamine-monophosphate kinase